MVLALFVLAAQMPQLDPLPLDRKLVGEWVTVATNGLDYKGYLWLTVDGRFTMKTVRGRIDTPAGNVKKRESMSGTFRYGKLNRASLKEKMSRFGEDPGDLPDWNMLRLYVSFEDALKQGAPKKSVEEMKASGEKGFLVNQLIFEPTGPLLHDLLTVAFARKGDEARIKRLMEQSRKPK